MRSITAGQTLALPGRLKSLWLRSLQIDERVWRIISVALTLIGVGVVGWQLTHFGFGELLSLLPDKPGFYIALTVLYLTLPISEWAIFNRLWGLPAAAITPFLRKAVINDVVLNYGGELYLYTWAKQRDATAIPGDADQPFGAIKDVSILSAIMANLLTLALMMAAIPFVGNMIPSWAILPAIGSGLILVLIPLIVTLFAHRVFSLPRSQLRFVAGVHLTRLVLSLVLGIVICSLAMPEIPLTVWVSLQTLRLLVSRLPLIPNKDLLFASALVLLVGRGSAVAALMSVTAMALLAMHLAVFLALLVLDLALPFRWASDANQVSISEG